MNVGEFLRNDHPVKIIVAGIEYPSVEHAFQATKTADVELKKKIAGCTAREAKSIGRGVSLPVDWDERRLEVMEALVRQKFFSNDDLRDKLIETGDEPLEMERRGDDFWGVDSDGSGENHLGKLIMKIRAEAQYIYGWQPQKEDTKLDEDDVTGRLDALIEFLDPDADLHRWSAWSAIEDLSTDESNQFDSIIRGLVKARRMTKSDDE